MVDLLRDLDVSSFWSLEIYLSMWTSGLLGISIKLVSTGNVLVTVIGSYFLNGMTLRFVNSHSDLGLMVDVGLRFMVMSDL